uniref:Uncharacterized protein LOC111109143 n=1 Tax=Crassostrea virginica TaxID=6565 RepID=A0A8B8BBX9_CRAVI|nr:uncharacterized protein LOC111109143 [Crassostrea virginica]
MGPKKRVTEGPPGTRPKRSKTSESSSTSSNAHVPEQLDYDKLATAIIRQTRSFDPPSVPSSSLVSQNQNNTSCSQAFQPTSSGIPTQPIQQNQPPSVPSSSLVSQNQNNTSCSQAFQPTSSGIPTQPIQQNQPPSVPSSSLVSQNQNNTSGLGSLIDQIFLGSFSNRPSSESASSASSQRVFDHLSSTSQHLLAASLSKSSAKAYHRSWSLLQSWKSQLTLPLTVVDVCNFIGFLFTSDYSPSSIASHISAISYVHKVMNIDDPTQAFVTKKILKEFYVARQKEDEDVLIGLVDWKIS